jgi:putative N6-adenine-specific DNA methylase
VNKQGNQLRLLAQIDCSEIVLDGFPRQGLLQFWILNDSLSGLSFDDPTFQDGFRVLYHPFIDETVSEMELTFKVFGNPFDDEDAFPVKGYSLSSKLTSIPACQSVLKKAIVEKLKAQYHTEFLPERGIEKKIRFSIVKDMCTLMLDTSGDGLHKRGYRPLLNEAPIRETLAAGMCDLARVYDDSRVHDPFCGSGTLVIEAAMRALNMAPGLNRRFAAEEYDIVGREIFDEVRQEARSMIKQDIAFCGTGSDIDENAVRIANDNAERAGVAKYCSFSVADARKLTPEEGSLIITNPPYGERLSDQKQCRALYHDLFLLKQRHPTWKLCAISSDPAFERSFGRRADRKRRLYNGRLECVYYIYY